MMRNVNVADEARRMSNGELAATIRTLSDEQVRRAAVPADQQPNPRAVEIAERRREKLFGRGAR